MTQVTNHADRFTPDQQRAGMRRVIIGQCFGLTPVLALWAGGLGMVVVLAFGGSKLQAMIMQSSMYVGFIISVLISVRPLPQDRIRYIMTCYARSSLFLMLAGCSLLMLPEKWVVHGFVLSLFFYRAIAGTAAVYWGPILQDFIPESVRGRFFSYSRAFNGLVVLLVILSVTRVINIYVDEASDLSSKRLIYGLLMILFGLMVLVRNVFLAKVPSVPRSALEDPPPDGLKEIFSVFSNEKDFARFMVYSLLLHTILSWITPMLVATLKDLEFADSQIVTITILGTVGGVVTNFVCTGFVDRLGPRRLFQIGHVVLAFCTLGIVGHRLVPDLLLKEFLVLLNMLMMGMQAMIIVATMTYLFQILKGSRRNLCFSMHLCLISISSILAAPLLGLILDWCPIWLNVDSLDLGSGLFVFISLFLFVTLPMARRVKEGEFPLHTETRRE